MKYEVRKFFAELTAQQGVHLDTEQVDTMVYIFFNTARAYTQGQIPSLIFANLNTIMMLLLCKP
jgi:hypothetical protein